MTLKFKKKEKTVSIEEWSRGFGSKLAYQVISAMVAQKETVGEENFKMITMTFIAGFISALLNTLMREEMPSEDKLTIEEKYKIAESNFEDFKLRLQDSVAAGFQAGVLSWSGQTMEYYALIKPVPEPVNKRPC